MALRQHQDLFVLRTLCTALIVATFSVQSGRGQDATSILTGLLSSLSASKSPGCPGDCRPAFMALFCDHVNEEATCSDVNMKCCTTPSPGAPTTPKPSEETPPPPKDVPTLPHKQQQHNSMVTRPGNLTGTGTAVAIETQPPIPPVRSSINHGQHRRTTAAPQISIATNLTVISPNRVSRPRPGSHPGHRLQGRNPARRPSSTTTATPTTQAISTTLNPTVGADAKRDDEIVEDNKSQKPTASVCRGICVSGFVAQFCGRLSDHSSCSPGEKCCLTDPDDADEPTPAQIPATPTTTSTQPPMLLITPAPLVATTSISVRRTTTLSPKVQPKQTTTPKIIEAPLDDDDDEVGTLQCHGSCVAGLLSLFCDEIDIKASCPNGGKCCNSKDPDEPIVRHPIEKPSSTGGIVASIRPASSAVAVTQAPTTTQSTPSKTCPGMCLPTLLSGVCNKPAVLIPGVAECKSGSICCDNSYREAATTTTPKPDILNFFASQLLGAGLGESEESKKPFPLNLLPILRPVLGAATGTLSGPNPKPAQVTTIGALLSAAGLAGAGAGGGGGSAGSSGSSGSQATAPDRMQDDRPPCPGSCISTYLTVTCFGSHAVVENFSCLKDNLVCCLKVSTIPGPGRQPIPRPLPKRNETEVARPIVAQSSDISSATVRPPSRYVCGVKGAHRPETPRVVGGRDSSPGEWCWQSALINSMNQYLCGGALIGRQWVLTAAHCVTNLVRSGDAVYVRVGDYDLTSKYTSPGGQTLRVATTYIHHNHNSQTLDNNIALLKLERPVELKEGVCIGCLPARGVQVEPGRRCTVTGYGYMGESGPIPLRIREAVLPVVSDQDCQKKIKAVTDKTFMLPASSFCAGGEAGHDACQGDGGGPLSCEVDGYYEVTGIVSWGFGCGRQDVPGIYVKVSSFIGWINQIISVNNA